MARLWVNYVCIIGIVVGLFSVLGSWAQYNVPPSPDPEVHILRPCDIMAPILFLVGTLLAIITPLGGILQLLSSIDFIIARQSLDVYGYHISIFPLIGILSSIIVLYSIRMPNLSLHKNRVSPSPPGRENSARLKLFTFSLVTEEVNPPGSHKDLSQRSLDGIEKPSEKGTAPQTPLMLIAILMIIAFFLLWEMMFGGFLFSLNLFSPAVLIFPPALTWMAVIIAFFYSDNVFARKFTVVMAIIFTILASFWLWVMSTVVTGI